MAAIASITPRFNARRMIKAYVERYYVPASKRHVAMNQNGYARAKELAEWRARVTSDWDGLYFSAKPLTDELHRMGDEIVIEAVLHARDIDLADVRVEVVYGVEHDELRSNLNVVEMRQAETLEDGTLYRACFEPTVSGRLVYGVRAYPVHQDLVGPFEAGFIRWA